MKDLWKKFIEDCEKDMQIPKSYIIYTGEVGAKIWNELLNNEISKKEPFVFVVKFPDLDNPAIKLNKKQYGKIN